MGIWDMAICIWYLPWQCQISPLAPEGHRSIAHGTSRGKLDTKKNILAPEGRKKTCRQGSIAPPGLYGGCVASPFPPAHAGGYRLPPLRGVIAPGEVFFYDVFSVWLQPSCEVGCQVLRGDVSCR